MRLWIVFAIVLLTGCAGLEKLEKTAWPPPIPPTNNATGTFTTVTADTYNGIVIGDCTDADCTADEILDDEDISPTAGTWDLSNLTITFPANGFYFDDADGSPTLPGQLRYDNTVTGLSQGAMAYFGDEVRYIVDVATLPTTTGQTPQYDASLDKWVPTMTGGVVTASKSANYTVGTDDPRESYGGVIYVTSAATITLEAVQAQMGVTVITIGAIAVSVDVNASDRMYLDGTALDDGDKATNTSTTGDMIVCTYESSAGWYCASNNWTDGGA